MIAKVPLTTVTLQSSFERVATASIAVDKRVTLFRPNAQRQKVTGRPERRPLVLWQRQRPHTNLFLLLFGKSKNLTKFQPYLAIPGPEEWRSRSTGGAESLVSNLVVHDGVAQSRPENFGAHGREGTLPVPLCAVV